MEQSIVDPQWHIVRLCRAKYDGSTAAHILVAILVAHILVAILVDIWSLYILCLCRAEDGDPGDGHWT